MSSSLARTAPDLPALIGSRICHDLISPIGAIGNGIELLTMSGVGLGPELSLVSESVANANVRIRFYRIAFGLASDGQGVSRAEIRSILNEMYAGGRLTAVWTVDSDCRRDEAKATFLAILCLETAMPFGGSIRVLREDGRWIVEGTTAKPKIDEAIWGALERGSASDVTPALVHFALLPEALSDLGRPLRVERTEDRITLSF